MKAPLTHPTYADIEKGCANLALQITRTYSPTNAINGDFTLIALSRGGLIPGVILSHMLNVALTPVCYSAKTGHGDNLNHLNNLPDLTAPVGSYVIIVDDIADSGHTLRDVVAHYNQKYCVETAVLYWKHGMSVHTPDYHWQEIQKHDPWIIFPWEA